MKIAVFLLATTTVAQAASVLNLSLTNNSSVDSQTQNTGFAREFATEHSFGLPVVSGDTITFTSRMATYNGHYVDDGGPTVALVHKRNVVYDLSFTVDDPLNRGYTITVDSGMRGFAEAIWEMGGSNVVATGLTVSGRIDTDTNDDNDTLTNQIGELTLFSNSATANSTTPNLRVATDTSKQLVLDEIVGTRDMAMRFTSVVTPTTNVFLQNNHQGQGSVQFGLNNTLNELDPSGQPVIGDAYAPENLGHFVTVTVDYNPIPEPSISAIWLAMFVALLGRRKR